VVISWPVNFEHVSATTTCSQYVHRDNKLQSIHACTVHLEKLFVAQWQCCGSFPPDLRECTVVVSEPVMPGNNSNRKQKQVLLACVFGTCVVSQARPQGQVPGNKVSKDLVLVSLAWPMRTKGWCFLDLELGTFSHVSLCSSHACPNKQNMINSRTSLSGCKCFWDSSRDNVLKHYILLRAMQIRNTLEGGSPDPKFLLEQ
jgi:hypothetical protein